MRHPSRRQTGFPDQEIVLFKDERVAVSDPTRSPFRWICALEVEFSEPVIYPLGPLEHPGKGWKEQIPTRKGCGSGLLISPKHVLTASHVIAGLKILRDRKTGATRFKLVRAKKVNVIPGRDAGKGHTSRPFGVFTSEKILFHPGFRAALERPLKQVDEMQIRKALSFDIGVIELSEKTKAGLIPPGLLTGWWREQAQYRIRPLTIDFRSTLQHNKVHVVGYPGDKGLKPCSTLWQSSGKVVSAFPRFQGIKENLLFYQADTSAGMSGSPVWTKWKDGRYYLVAVHSSYLNYTERQSGEQRIANVGTLITPKHLRRLQAWKVNYLELIIPNVSA